MTHDLRYTAEKIAARLKLIRPHLTAQSQLLEPFRVKQLSGPHDLPDLAAEDGMPLAWHSHWATSGTHFVLRSGFTLPPEWQTPALHLPLGQAGDIFTHPEALLYIDGEPLASADRYHHTIEIDPSLADGRRHALVLHGWTGLTGWPHDPDDKTQLYLRPCKIIDIDRALQTFVVRAEVALDVANHLSPDRPERHGILNALDHALTVLDTRDPIGPAMRRTVQAANAALEEGLAKAGPALDVDLHAIGHAHMDVAYMWTVSEIRHKNARTYSNALRLMERHPEFTFSHSQPQLYKYTEQDYPGIFDGIRARVAEGRWEVLVGMWVEPDANMPGAEALVRQLLLARHYVRSRFGPVETPVLWLPDTFGFPASLPQIMAQAGLRYFVTNKVNWNQYNQMPASTTWWEGIDGTRVLAQFLTTPRPVQHLPFPTNYKSDLSAEEVLGTWARNAQKHSVRDLMICYGYGDGGGGPTDNLIRKARAFADLPGAPKLRAGTVRRYFQALEAHGEQYPTWVGEFYLEGHRGVLTSQGWIKRANRKNEVALHDAEGLACLAMALGAEPKRLDRAWELLCLNQFHDILTGTSITTVFEDAWRDHLEISDRAAGALNAAAEALSDAAPAAAVLMAYNPAPYAGPRLARVPTAQPLADATTGAALPLQADGDGALVLIDMVPSGLSALSPVDTPGTVGTPVTARLSNGGAVLENAHLRVEIGADGTLAAITDLALDRPVLRSGARGNVLQCFEDRPVSWDAWDIDIFFEDRQEEIDQLTALEISEIGPLRATVTVRRTWRASTIEQRISLMAGRRRIDFATEIDWRQSHMLVKAAFPVAIRADRATYDIQFGQVERTTHRNTSWDAAQFEVPAQRWADLSEDGYGVALLNDGKYGYDIKGDVMRLSLLRSPTMPDAISDQGRHSFTYSLLPHPGDWRGTVQREAWDLNHPVPVFAVAGQGGGLPAPPLVSESANAVVETLKPAEDGRGIIARIYESHRRRGPVRLRVADWIASVEEVGLLEDGGRAVDVVDGAVSLTLRPYQIVTLRLVPRA